MVFMKELHVHPFGKALKSYSSMFDCLMLFIANQNCSSISSYSSMFDSLMLFIAKELIPCNDWIKTIAISSFSSNSPHDWSISRYSWIFWPSLRKVLFTQISICSSNLPPYSSVSSYSWIYSIITEDKLLNIELQLDIELQL